MKAISLIAASALTLSTALPAQASGCYPSLAANVVANSIRGGLTPTQAFQEARASGSFNGTNGCAAQVIGYMRSQPYLYSDLVR